MKFFVVLTCAVIVIYFEANESNAQLPPRLTIPGAVLVSQPKPLQYRQQRILQQPESSPVPKRRPIPNAVPISIPIRPVVEESEENETPNASQILDDEVSKLGLSALQSAIRTASVSDNNEQEHQQQQQHQPQRPVPFRPERPLPILRQDIRDSRAETPAAVQRQTQVFRQDSRTTQSFRPTPVTRQQQEEVPVYRQQAQARAQVAQPAPQSFRQAPRVQQPTRQQYAEDNTQHQQQQHHHEYRTRKPPIQILRKYRTDNEDGSITWGYENEDGSFKEETLGNDCVTKGKYGYIDPDGVKREYTYETGNKCDEPEEEDLPPQALPPQGGKQGIIHNKKQQYRPLPPQAAQY